MGDSVGESVGAADGAAVGARVGDADGVGVGDALGSLTSFGFTTQSAHRKLALRPHCKCRSSEIMIPSVSVHIKVSEQHEESKLCGTYFLRFAAQRV